MSVDLTAAIKCGCEDLMGRGWCCTYPACTCRRGDEHGAEHFERCLHHAKRMNLLERFDAALDAHAKDWQPVEAAWEASKQEQQG